MEAKFKKKGYSLTKPRLAVIKVLKKQHKPISCQEIYKKLNKKVDLASIYRILKLFSQLKIVQVDIIDRESYYFLSKKHHHHITCNKCGYIQCVPCKNINLDIKNFSKINHQLILTGVCNKCY